MASIRARTSAAGVTTYAVLFRHQGKQQSRTFVTEKAAEDWRALVDNPNIGPEKALAMLEQESDGITVDELAAAYFTWKADDVTDRTLGDYRRDYRNWLQPTFGHRPADSIDERDVQRWIDGLARQLEPKTVGHRHTLLHSMFKFGAAKSRRLVDYNPCTETQLPKRKKRPPRSATLVEWQAVHAAGQQVDPDADDLMLFIVGTSWRWSEAAALLVAGIEEYPDHTTGRVHMFASMQRVFRKDSHHRQVVAEDEGKSRAAIRRAKIPDVVADMVRRRIEGKGPGDLVFTNRYGRKWYQQNFLYRVWPRIIAASGVERPITPHWFRHMHVALLDRAGASLPEMQRRVGHESIQTTINVYGSGIDDISDETLDNLNDLLAGRTVQGEVVPGTVVPGVVLGELD